MNGFLWRIFGIIYSLGCILIDKAKSKQAKERKRAEEVKMNWETCWNFNKFRMGHHFVHCWLFHSGGPNNSGRWFWNMHCLGSALRVHNPPSSTKVPQFIRSIKIQRRRRRSARNWSICIIWHYEWEAEAATSRREDASKLLSFPFANSQREPVAGQLIIRFVKTRLAWLLRWMKERTIKEWANRADWHTDGMACRDKDNSTHLTRNE